MRLYGHSVEKSLRVVESLCMKERQVGLDGFVETLDRDAFLCYGYLWLMAASLSLLNKAVNTLSVCKLRRYVILYYAQYYTPAKVIHATTYRKPYITHLSPTKSLWVSEQNAQRQFTRLLLQCVTVWLRESSLWAPAPTYRPPNVWGCQNKTLNVSLPDCYCRA